MITHTSLRTSTIAVAVAILAAVLHAQAPTPPPAPSVKVGQEAPDFTASYLAAPDANGRRQRKEVKLSDFKGQKNVVLAFFPAAFSPGCTNEMAKYQETTGQFNANNTMILGISVDSDEKVYRDFLAKARVSFLTARDPDRKISADYGTFKYPESYIIDAKGKVLRKIISNQDWMSDRVIKDLESLL